MGLQTPGRVVAVVAASSALSRCAGWSARIGRSSMGICKKALGAEVGELGNSKVRSLVVGLVVLEVDVSCTCDRCRESFHSMGVNGLAIRVIRISSRRRSCRC